MTPIWPDYEFNLRNAKLNKKGTGPNRNGADFMWAKTALKWGFTPQQVEQELAKVSERAQQEIKRGNPGYARVTVWNAKRSLDARIGF
jgi:hypothetical protein